MLSLQEKLSLLTENRFNPNEYAKGNFMSKVSDVVSKNDPRSQAVHHHKNINSRNEVLQREIPELRNRVNLMLPSEARNQAQAALDSKILEYQRNQADANYMKVQAQPNAMGREPYEQEAARLKGRNFGLKVGAGVTAATAIPTTAYITNLVSESVMSYIKDTHRI